MYTEPVKITKKKKIELILLIVFAIWIVIFGINYVRYSKGKSLILAINVISDYEDGSVKEYISLGYVYRIYNRSSISREEFVPFWVLKENPPVDDGIPDTYKDYTVPDNKSKLGKYKGLLYFYSSKRKLIGTYKCINTNTRCEKATSGYDSFNLINKDPLTRKKDYFNFPVIHEKFAFVDDSKEQDLVYGEPKYERIIYLFNIEDNEIIAKYSDIKEMYSDEYSESAGSNNDMYIVKSSTYNKWGIIKVNEDGSIDQILDFEYDSISYDQDTNYYILSRDDKWFVYDLESKKNILTDVINPIYDVWVSDNNTYFYKTGVDVVNDGFNYVNYSIYRFDGSPLLVDANVMEIIPRGNCYIYMDKGSVSLKVRDYTNRLLSEYKLYFVNLEYDDFSHPAFEIYKEDNNILYLKVYQGRELTFDFDYVDIEYGFLSSQ